MNLETEIETAKVIRKALTGLLTKALQEQEAAREVVATHPHPSPGSTFAYYQACGRSTGVASCIERVDAYITGMEAVNEQS